MFSFLNSTFATAHNFDDDSDEDVKHREETPKNTSSTDELSTIADLKPPSSLDPVNEDPLFGRRLRDLEEQNSKLVAQLSSLQNIIATKTSTCNEYKAKYEVSPPPTSSSLFLELLTFKLFLFSLQLSDRQQIR
jgi:hypothetical protein